MHRRLSRFSVDVDLLSRDVAPFDFGEYLTALGKTDIAEGLLGPPDAISEGRHGRCLALFDDYLTVGRMPGVVLAQAAGEDAPRHLRELFADLRNDFLHTGENLLAEFLQIVSLSKRRAMPHEQSFE